MKRDQKPARIVIVDDHPLVREGLTLRISAHRNLHVCGEAETEDQALEVIERLRPDLVIVDIALKSGHGIDLIKRVKSRFSQVKMLVVSGFQESLYAERALRAGALGYLNKQESNEKVLDAIRTVLDGERYVSEETTRRLVAKALGSRSETCNPMETLSQRELQIFRMIGQGMTSGAIADSLHLSTHTIDTHRENLKRKLGAQNGADLNRQAVQWVLTNG